jgi:phosphoglycerate kinase
MKSIREIDLKNKRVIVRVDYNIPYLDEKITDATRILKTQTTIEFLKSQNAKVILLSHLGRPDGINNTKHSLKFIVPFLENCFNTKVHFLQDLLDESAVIATQALKPKEIILFDNLRFYQGEEQNNDEFSKKIARLGDIYINDAFSCSHRAHASIVGVSKYLPSYPGLLLEEEVKNLQRLWNPNLKPITAIIGGKKVSTKFKVLKNLDKLVDYLIIGGAMANTFLKAQDYEIANSYHEPEFVNQAKKFMQSARSTIIIPTDAIIAKGLEVPSQKTSIVEVQNAIPQDHYIFDIGPQTLAKICHIIEDSKLVLWNGPLGLFEDARFKEGTDNIAKFIANLTRSRKIQSIIGGGDTIAAIESLKLLEDFTYASTAGGAFLEWLEGEELPGIKALKTGR